MSEWYTKGLLAYMLGLGEEEMEELINKYLEEGGVEDPRTLFAYLMRKCKEYVTSWALLSFSSQVTLLQVAVIGPDGQIIWTSQSTLPYTSKSFSLNKWPIVANILTKGSEFLPSSVNDAEFIAAQHANLQLRKVWPDVVGEAYTEFLQREHADASEDEEFLSREKLMEFERKFRVATGRNMPIVAFKFDKLSLPELRERSINLPHLDSAITRYLNQVVKKEEIGSYIINESIDEVAPLIEIDPQIDPIRGIPLSELHPGDVIFLASDDEEDEEIAAKVFMIRLLKDGRYEVHGTMEEEGKEVYFRFVAPGDIKVKAPQLGVKSGLDVRLILSLLFVILVFIIVLFLPF